MKQTHIPVILATQILESLAESGLRSRAEIADAIMGQRAECVMLNNGPYILEAIETLSGLLGKRGTTTTSNKESSGI